MKNFLFLLLIATGLSVSAFAATTFVGSTPAHLVVRNFLQISSTDSIDFIRWKLVVQPDRFQLECSYGLALGGTPGFSNEKAVALEGKLQKSGNQYMLQAKGKNLYILEVNTDLLHLLDDQHHMMIGNGGYSYALNNTMPQKTDKFNLQSSESISSAPQVFEGRTPCQELSALLSLNKSDACNKMKWYIIFHTDSLTGKPSYYLKGGIGYREETMEKGSWEIIKGTHGRVIYKVNSADKSYSFYLVKGDQNILFFAYPDGRLLVGNEHFSYTLNRRKEAYPRRS